MKFKNKNMLLLVAVMGSIIAASSQATPCVANGLELFPAAYDGKDSSSELKFLTKDPFLLDIESYHLDPDKRLVQIKITKSSSIELGKITENFIEKRLAIVVDGNVASAPVIKTKITGQELAITFDSDQSLVEFGKVLEANTNC